VSALKDRDTVRWLCGQIRKRIPALVIITLTHVSSAILGVLFALGTRWVIDSAVAQDRDSFTWACIAQGGLILLTLITVTYDRHIREKLSAQLDRDWKKSLLHRLLGGDYQAVSSYHTGELLNRLNNDVRIVNSAVISLVPGLASMTARLVAALAFLATMEWKLTLIVIAAGIFVVIVTGFLRRRLKGLHKQVSQEEGRVSGFIQETLNKLLFVQAMDVSQEVERRSDELLNTRYALHRKRKNISVMSSTCISILSYGAAFGALVWCAGGILEGAMTFGTMTAVSQLVGQLQGPFVNLSAIAPQYVAMIAAAERLQELEAVGSRPDAREDAAQLYRETESIRAENLCFAYDRDEVFCDAAFTLPKNSFGVIAGQSGIGKSTLLKLLLGVYRPSGGRLYLQTGAGEVTIDATTRSLFAYVPQGNLLLSGTIRDNLLLTKPNATEEELAQAVYTSCMDDYLKELPLGLDTPLGENAAGLSEGQAQRLSIARAVLSDAPILLLDEATSALDEETEKQVISRLKMLRNRTCIAVTHRPAPIAQSDWVLEVGEGKCRMLNAEC
jgi:ATP-binding cassette subfamily B protein